MHVSDSRAKHCITRTRFASSCLECSDKMMHSDVTRLCLRPCTCARYYEALIISIQNHWEVGEMSAEANSAMSVWGTYGR